MADFWQQFKKWFKSAEESSPSQPYLHELIERSDAEIADFAAWKTTVICLRLINWLNDQFAIYSDLPADVDEAIDFLHTPSSQGFVIHYFKTEYTRREATHFFDLLKEQVLRLPYRSHVSDTRTYLRDGISETVERHYLKPRITSSEEGILDQQYGNIQIELILRRDRPYRLKFQATRYNDRQYNEGADFRALMQRLFT